MSELPPLRESLHEKGYAPVPIEVSKSDLQTTIDHYMDFLELPETYHEMTRYDLTDRGDGDFGQYTRQSGMQSSRGAMPDNKDIFHYGSMSRQIIESRVHGELPRPMKNFLNAAEEVYWAGQRAKHNALREFDVCSTGLQQVLQTERRTLNDVLRFIAYYPSDDLLAKGHFDRSATTLAIGESHEGLQIAPGQNGLVVNADETYMTELEERLQPVAHKEYEAKMFLGAGWNRLPAEYQEGNEDMPLAFHNVVASAQKVSNKVMRWAVVMFNTPYSEFKGYTVPTPPETRPYKQLGRLVV